MVTPARVTGGQASRSAKGRARLSATDANMNIWRRRQIVGTECRLFVVLTLVQTLGLGELNLNKH
jgi:hypothetical protein